MSKRTCGFMTMLAMLLVFALACSQQKKQESQANQETAAAEQTEMQAEVKTVASWNTVCPVSGEPVNADAPTVTYDGKVYGFCCDKCDKKFQEKPADYAKNLSEDGSEYVGG